MRDSVTKASLVVVACLFGCDEAAPAPHDVFLIVYEQISVRGQTDAIHAQSNPVGIDCGPSMTACRHQFVRGTLVHLHIEQVDFACGTVSISRHVFEGSGSTYSVPFDQDVPAYGMDFGISCNTP